jgi:hypothetical protein
MKRFTTNWKWEEFPGMPHEARYGIVAAVVASAVVGAGASVYGSDKQSADSKAAAAANQQGVTAANDESWTSYLASRGVQTAGNVPYGEYPGGAAINTKLPLWATVNVPATETGPGGSSSLAAAFSNPTNLSTPSTMAAPSTAAPTAGTALPRAPGGYSPPVRSSPVTLKAGV